MKQVFDGSSRDTNASWSSTETVVATIHVDGADLDEVRSAARAAVQQAFGSVTCTLEYNLQAVEGGWKATVVVRSDPAMRRGPVHNCTKPEGPTATQTWTCPTCGRYWTWTLNRARTHEGWESELVRDR